MLDQSNQHIADRREWDEDRQRLEAEVARLRDALAGCVEQIYDDNYQFAKMNAAINGHENWHDDLPEAWHDAHRALEATNERPDLQRAFDNGVDAGKRLASYSELPF